jgi:curved DNA-binding protein CbpA
MTTSSGPPEDDPYKLLGVKPPSTDKEIRRAFLFLAKKFHPDKNPGDAVAEARFKAISAAHDLLMDAELRFQYDLGHVDMNGQNKPRPPGGYGYKPTHTVPRPAPKPATAAKPPPPISSLYFEAEFGAVLFGLFSEPR